MEYKLLNTINRSEDVADLNIEQLPQLCDEVRHFLIENVSKTGGHLSANLGTVEAITAMHYNFVTPLNEFVFDVGHQCYTHKIYTGRRKKHHERKVDDYGKRKEFERGTRRFPGAARWESGSRGWRR